MNKITEQDLANRGVKGLPDVPGLTTEEMQRKMEEIPRDILIPKINELVENANTTNSNLNTKKCNFGYFLTGANSGDFKLNGTLSEKDRIPIIFYITEQNGYFCNYHISILRDSDKIVPFKIAGDMDVTASFDFSTQILHLEYSKASVWGSILFLTIDRFYITEA